MKKLLSLTAFAFAATMILSPVAHAQDAPAKTAQQTKMGACNKDAEGKKGDERKAFMSSCLKGEAAAPAKMTQQEKMKACNADTKAKTLKGDDRKKFMSSCLSGGAAASP